MKDSDYVLVTTVSQFRMRYVMHKDDLQAMNTQNIVKPIEWAQDTVTMQECEEFSQEHLGEIIISTDMMTEETVLDLFNRENSYLSSWSDEYKLKWIRKLLKMEIGE